MRYKIGQRVKYIGMTYSRAFGEYGVVENIDHEEYPYFIRFGCAVDSANPVDAIYCNEEDLQHEFEATNDLLHEYYGIPKE